MKKWYLVLFTISFSFIIDIETGFTQDVKPKNSLELKLSGRVQLQHFYNDAFRTADTLTYHGFRIRLGLR